MCTLFARHIKNLMHTYAPHSWTLCEWNMLERVDMRAHTFFFFSLIYIHIGITLDFALQRIHYRPHTVRHTTEPKWNTFYYYVCIIYESARNSLYGVIRTTKKKFLLHELIIFLFGLCRIDFYQFNMIFSVDCQTKKKKWFELDFSSVFRCMWARMIL